jgi:pyruvate/2-oxoacid:ferredoxin oxidoreductase alpha subunit
MDTVIQAYKVSEDPSVLLPAFVTYDGWEVSHNSKAANKQQPNPLGKKQLSNDHHPFSC